MTEDEIRRAERLAYLVKRTISERKYEWIMLVCHVYKGEVLPAAVAASLESLEARTKLKGKPGL